MKTGDMVLLSHQQKHLTVPMFRKDHEIYECICLVCSPWVNITHVIEPKEYATYQKNKKPPPA